MGGEEGNGRRKEEEGKKRGKGNSRGREKERRG